MKYWFALVLLVISSQTVLANDTVRIGVFWLYDIRVVQASSIESPVTVSGNEKRPDIILTTGRRLSVQRDGKSLLCSVIDRSGRTVQQWHDASIVLNANNVDGESSLSIPGKIVRTFRGTITITPASPAPSAPKTEIRVVLETDRENAIAAVAASEMPISSGKADLQALKSFSVVIRTFMTSHPHRHSEEGFDFCDSTHCQHYQGEEFTARLSGRLARQAAKETSGHILSFEGRPIEAYFTGACGGMTTTPLVAWGTAPSGAYTNWTVRCTWCRQSHFYRWERHVDAGRLFDATTRISNLKLTSHGKIETVDADNGFVQGIRISDDGASAVMSISKFRSDIGRILGWNTFISNAFTLERQGSEFVIRGRGFGHNVGLCIEGALRQSEAGRDWKTILNYYFPRADVTALEMADK